MGEHDTDAKNGKRVEIDIDRVLMHESYSYTTQKNDIAIAYLVSDVEFTGKLNFLSLYLLNLMLK